MRISTTRMRSVPGSARRTGLVTSSVGGRRCGPGSSSSARLVWSRSTSRSRCRSCAPGSSLAWPPGAHHTERHPSRSPNFLGAGPFRGGSVALSGRHGATWVPCRGTGPGGVAGCDSFAREWAPSRPARGSHHAACRRRSVPCRVMEPSEAEDTRTIGRRLREIRVWRRKSQRVVAELAGISEGYLSKLERGLSPVERRSLIVALANALQVAPSELTQVPVPAPGNGHTDSTVEAVRRALAAVNHGRPDGMVLPFEVLADRVDQLRQDRRACRLHDVATALPGLIRDVHTSLDAGRDVGELLPLVVTLHVDVTSMWLKDAGAPVDLRGQAALLARNAAREHGEVTTLGMAAFGTVNALRATGDFDLAQAELNATTLPAATPETVDLVGTLMEQHAQVAAVGNRHADVDAAMAIASELAERFGEVEPIGFGFGPTNVGLRRMSLALEAGEPDRALNIAGSVRPERAAFATRQAAYWVDFGRAAAHLRGRRDDAVRAFRTAEDLFPARVYRNPFARDTVTELLTRARRDAGGRDLRALAHRMGLVVRRGFDLVESLSSSAHLVDDLVGGFVPDEGLGVVVPVLGPELDG
ncbi:MAG: helix-turn-helix domain-containing protein, partial [Pseudonocardiaceae bacterium]|nr:helix-turn-helix domain-containing protein [Pseudonocardiaceae bacterium]